MSSEKVCRHCGSEGMKVVPLTLGVHVKEEHWSKIDENFYFCPSRECDVVYFNNISGVYLTKAEVKTRVGIKEDSEPRPLCYCNRVTDEMLRKAILEEGCCSSIEEVQEVTGAGKGKWCITTNPSGRCCEWYLKDIINSYLREANVKPAQKKAAKEQKLRRLVLEITGMTCQGCVGVVQGALESTGATNVKVSLSEGKAEMLIPEEESLEKFVKAVRDAGYGARGVEEEKK
jgi:copper chaperone CopZ/bacterioferritin-associated ferredoxin